MPAPCSGVRMMGQLTRNRGIRSTTPRPLANPTPKGAPNIKGLVRLRYVVEQAFALLHQFKRLAVRWKRRTELPDAFVSLACGLICWRRLKKHRS
ncbi:hypothetical protein [Streptomyces aureus]|uniref:hypothetical protein n=1 Tax=Streptomyces aureus TaxID=193461 RepID=UPI0033F6BFB4